MKAPVIVEEYNHSWPSLFEEEKNNILRSIGDKCESIEHIGSTAVPDLGAKPIIDIMIGVKSLTEADKCIGPMIELGYDYIKEHEDLMPERLFLPRGLKRKAGPIMSIW